jgi:dihydroorotase
MQIQSAPKIIANKNIELQTVGVHSARCDIVLFCPIFEEFSIKKILVPV